MEYLFIRRYFVFWLILSLYYSTGLAQQQNSDLGDTYAKRYESYQKTYGFDQELVNGIFYENPYWKALGHPFLLENLFYTGTLIYHGKRYDHVKMKYDIYEQKILINYGFNDKQLNILLINKFISEFSLIGKTFGYFSFPDMKPAFFQVIDGGNNLKCLYYWYKERRESYHNRTYSSYEFSGSIKKSYLLLQDKLLPFKNNPAFIQSFPLKNQDQIRRFMKTNKIKVKTCDDSSMLKLLNYCITLPVS